MKWDTGDNYFEKERNNIYVTIYEERLICLVEKTVLFVNAMNVIMSWVFLVFSPYLPRIKSPSFVFPLQMFLKRKRASNIYNLLRVKKSLGIHHEMSHTGPDKTNSIWNDYIM